MQMLQPIACDVFQAMIQLVEYYFITIYNMFTPDLKTESHQTVPSFKFSSLTKRVSQCLLKPAPMPSSESGGGISLNKTSINNFLNDLNKSTNSLAASNTNADNGVANPEGNDDTSPDQVVANGGAGHGCMNLDLAKLNPVVDLTIPE